MPVAWNEQQWALLLRDNVKCTHSLLELDLVSAGKFEELFRSHQVRHFLGTGVADLIREDFKAFMETLDYASFLENYIATFLSTIEPEERGTHLNRLLAVGIAALESFIQSNVTGPPLSFSPEDIFLPQAIRNNLVKPECFSATAIAYLGVDGETVYHLVPHAILLVVAKTVLNIPTLTNDPEAPTTTRWWRMRVNFLHQKLLSNPTATLHNLIYDDLDVLVRMDSRSSLARAKFLIEKAAVDIYFGYEEKAWEALTTAAGLTGLKFVLTGVLGKRTKFQQNDLSQLVVLARSVSPIKEVVTTERPQSLSLNDDTLLESISFAQVNEDKATTPAYGSSLPSVLQPLDPGDQPPLHPLDGTILLLFTEAIKNANTDTGITREEILPYAERVLCHSTNWQVYTHALVIRSRIECHKPRTVERGVFQLQAVVDQIIAETAMPGKSQYNIKDIDTVSDTQVFLPRSEESKSASIQERLRYIYQLSYSTRWELEAELASRWANLGALKTALDVYERLQMWPEVALCWAATDQEEKAREVLRNQLFEDGGNGLARERIPAPHDAPRLWCILGDIDKNLAHYERSWVISGKKYARAQRSLGQYYLSVKDYHNAAAAYTTSLSVNPLNSQSWYTLGCCLLELKRYGEAADAFRRVIGIEEDDAEAWNNLATALLHRDPILQEPLIDEVQPLGERYDGERQVVNHTDNVFTWKQKNKRDALGALKRACQLKRDSWKIWHNYLIVAAGVVPPSYNEIVIATKNIIQLRKDSVGETAVDSEILEMLVNHVILSTDAYDSTTAGLPKMVINLIEKDVVPLITTNARLWKLVARLQLWMRQPKASLEAQEKAWRAISSRFDITNTISGEWETIVEATIDLVDAYQSLGPMENTAQTNAGDRVSKDWQFKARAAVKGVMGRGKQNWVDTKAYHRLAETLDSLKHE